MAEIMNAGTESPVELVTVDRPEAGETLTVLAASGLQIVLAFDPAGAGFGVEGDDFILTFEDGARIVFQGLISAAQGADAPTIQIGGIEIDADVLVEQVLALAEQAQAEPIETAAGEAGEGEAAEGGGGSHYDDSFGDLIAGLAKQGIIGETELGFGLIGDGNTELPADAQFLSEGHANGGGFAALGVGISSETPPADSAPSATPPADPAPSVTPPASPDPDVTSDPGPAPSETPVEDAASPPAPLSVNGIDIITNEATGNLEIPDQLLLYLATEDHGEYLSMIGPSNGDGDNAYIWEAGVGALNGADPANTWANHVTDNVKFHIGNGNSLYEGSFTYEMTDGSGNTGTNAVGVRNVETGNDRGYWTLEGTDSEEGEVLLGLDGRNKITGGDGDDIIHGGHDASGDILIGGDGDDVIFGGSGNDDLQGGDGADNFIMSAGFGRDDVDGGISDIDGDGDVDTDTITLDGVLTPGDVDDLSSWLTLDSGFSFAITADGVISLGDDASGTISLGGGNEIAFVNIEQIVFTDVA